MAALDELQTQALIQQMQSVRNWPAARDMMKRQFDIPAGREHSVLLESLLAHPQITKKLVPREMENLLKYISKRAVRDSALWDLLSFEQREAIEGGVRQHQLAVASVFAPYPLITAALELQQLAPGAERILYRRWLANKRGTETFAQALASWTPEQWQS